MHLFIQKPFGHNFTLPWGELWIEGLFLISVFEMCPFVIECKENFWTVEGEIGKEKSTDILHCYSYRQKSKQELKVLPIASFGSEGIQNKNKKVATTSALRESFQ